MQGIFDPSLIQFEFPVGTARVDIVIANRYAIELKFKTEDNKITGIIGQITRYSQKFKHVFLVIGLPQYHSNWRNTLIAGLQDLPNVTLIEIK